LKGNRSLRHKAGLLHAVELEEEAEEDTGEDQREKDSGTPRKRRKKGRPIRL
jgi:hypothetical protein